MIQQVLDGIVGAIREEFSLRVYQEEVAKGIQKPYFLVQVVKPSEVPLLGGRSRRYDLFSVEYFPGSKTDARAEAYEVNERLFRALGVISVENELLRGLGRKGEYKDGRLLFSVGFCYFVESGEVAEMMERVQVLRGW